MAHKYILNTQIYRKTDKQIYLATNGSSFRCGSSNAALTHDRCQPLTTMFEDLWQNAGIRNGMLRGT